MQVVHRDSSPTFGASAHRPGGIGFVSLLKGEEGAPDNFELLIATITDEYSTPKHRHNFDQVRIMLSGEFGFGPEYIQRQGSVGYFSEGTYYEQHGVGESETLLLQAGGASGYGFVSFNLLYATVDKLKKKGEFHDGTFSWEDDAGVKHHKDSYEAAWEEVNHRELTYPRPRFQGPIIANPDAFAWLTTNGTPGVFERQFGVFHERGIALSQLKLDAGARMALPAEQATSLFFVYDGSGSVGEQLLSRHSAFKLSANETPTLNAVTDMYLQRIRLAQF